MRKLRNRIHESLCCVLKTDTILFINYISIKKKENSVWLRALFFFHHNDYMKLSTDAFNSVNKGFYLLDPDITGLIMKTH